MTGAVMRGFLVALLIATPSLVLPTVPAETAQIVAFVAIAGMFLTILEYGSSYPCLFEFRDAAPFNRLRFFSVLLAVAMVSLIARHHIQPTGLTAFVTSIGYVVGGIVDFPFSPLRGALPPIHDEAAQHLFHTVRAAVGMSILVFGASLALFVLELHRGQWPRAGLFNVWINLPTFDPTRGGDVVTRLDRDGKVNIVIAVVLPFLLPLVLNKSGHGINTLSVDEPQSLVWAVTIWIGLPYSLAFRGLAMQRIAAHDRRAPPRHDLAARRAGAPLIRALALLLALAAPAGAESLRLATFDTELSQRGPGLLLRDLVEGPGPRARAVISMIDAAAPDVLILQDMDYDAGNAALKALNERLAVPYPHLFARLPNSGMPTGLDLDGDELRGGPRDAQGYGNFAGDGGMAILSRHPIGEAPDLSDLLWRDLPGNIAPEGTPEIQRLSTTGHWIVPVEVEGQALTLMTWAATPPVFDGPEDRNGRRANDEAALWLAVLEGTFGPAPEAPFVLAGLSNIDPVRGEGRREALSALLVDPRLQDPLTGPTARFDPPTGPLRVSYILPSADLNVTGAGLEWPPDGTEEAPRHALLWVDLALP